MVQGGAEASTTPGALSGIRVLDFTWVRAGPWCTRWLGALGAEVIKVEWPQSPNTRGANIATGAGTPEGFSPNLNTDGHFSDTNSNKLSVTLNTRTAQGIDLTRRLVAMSDIVIENFAYGVLERWGLGYEEMKKLRPDIIYLSMSGFGHTGRDRDYQTMGAIAQALSGMTYTSGLPDKPPAGWGWSYLDDTGGLYGAMYALSAIYHRNLTGQGQHVDSSQWILGVPLNGAAFLDIQANGRSTMREGYPPGNRAHWPGAPLADNYRGRTGAPHNAYKTSPAEHNDWCVLACFSDDEWRKLVEVMGSPGGPPARSLPPLKVAWSARKSWTGASRRGPGRWASTRSWSGARRREYLPCPFKAARTGWKTIPSSGIERFTGTWSIPRWEPGPFRTLPSRCRRLL